MTSVWDGIYESGRQINRWPDTQVVSRCSALLTDPGRRVLELGCGTGNNARYFAEMQHYYIGVDASREALRQVRLRAKERDFCEFYQQDVTESPWKFRDAQTSSFELVLDRACLSCCTLAGAHNAIGEAFRVLAPGGHMVCIDWFTLPHALNQDVEVRDPEGYEGMGLIRFVGERSIPYMFREWELGPVETRVVYSGGRGRQVPRASFSFVARKPTL